MEDEDRHAAEILQAVFGDGYMYRTIIADGAWAKMLAKTVAEASIQS